MELKILEKTAAGIAPWASPDNEDYHKVVAASGTVLKIDRVIVTAKDSARFEIKRVVLDDNGAVVSEEKFKTLYTNPQKPEAELNLGEASIDVDSSLSQELVVVMKNLSPGPQDLHSTVVVAELTL